jgi:hypothetical protein
MSYERSCHFLVAGKNRIKIEEGKKSKAEANQKLIIPARGKP